MQPRELLDIYTSAYNAKKSEGGLREVPSQHAHVAGLEAVLAMGGGGDMDLGDADVLVTTRGIKIPNEDPGHAHQRRLTASQYWLNQGDRRARYATRATFTDIVDAFAAGGAFERAFFDGEGGEFHTIADQLLADTKNDVERKLAEHQGMAQVLDILGELTDTDNYDDLLARVQALVEPGAVPGASDTALTPSEGQAAE